MSFAVLPVEIHILECIFFSFAIIFSEVVMRECPFKNLKLSNQEIVDLIAGRTTPYMNRVN